MILGLLVLLCCILLPLEVMGQEARSLPNVLFRNEVDLLRADNGRLYLWAAEEIPLNSDFTMQFVTGGQIGYECAVESVLGQVLISEALPDSLVTKIGSEENLYVRILLDSSQLAQRPLEIGLPLGLAALASQDLGPLVSTLGNATQISLYQNLDDAEVELAVGHLDMLLLPQNEVASDHACRYQIYPTPWRVEWYLASDLSDFDLLPAALSYSLKGLLAESGRVSSTLVDSVAAERYFPASRIDAAALFAQMSDAQSQRTINWYGDGYYPATLGNIRRHLSACGAAVRISPEAATSKLQLLPIFLDDRDSLASASASRQLDEFLLGAGFSWHGLINDSSGAAIDLSQQLSRELKLVPLGTQRLVLLARPQVHRLTDHFYLVKQR